jgi:hypothetical protein
MNNRTPIQKLIALTLIFSVSTSIFAVTSQPIESPQPLWTGARVQGLGGGVPTLFGDNSAVMINPASLGSTDVMPLSISSQRIIGQFDYFTVNTGFEFEAPFSFQGRLKQNVAVGLSYGSMSSGGIPRTLLDTGAIRQDGTFSSGFDMVYLAGSTDLYDINGFNIIAIGSGLKFLRQTVNERSRTGMGLDIGAIGTYHMNEGLVEKIHVGASIQNFLATPLKWDFTDPNTGTQITNEGQLPIQFYAGVRADMLDDKLSVFAQNGIDGISFGTEYWIDKALCLRAGTNFKLISVGTGLLLENVVGGLSENNGYGLRFDISYTQNTAPLDLNPNINFSISLLGESRPKTPQIFTPLQDTTTREKSIRLAGVGPKNASIQIYNNKSLARTLNSDRYGNWQIPQFPLNEGKNRVYAGSYSLEKSDSSKSDSVLITSDSTPPSFNVKIYPENRRLVVVAEPSEPLIELSGKIGSIPLNFEKEGEGWVARTSLPGEITAGATPPSEYRVLSLLGKDKAGNLSEEERHSFFATLDTPQDKLVHYRNEVRFLGKSSKFIRGILINGEAVYVDSQNRFTSAVRLQPGKNMVKVTLKPIQGEDLIYGLRILRLVTFPDLDKKVKERREIEFLATLGILEGDPDGNFYPDRPITRRYMARTLVKLKKLPLDTTETSQFSDVSANDPDSAYIQAALQNGILFAYPDGTFKPDQGLTLSEALSLLNNAGVVDEVPPASGETEIARRKDLAQYLAYTPKYEVQIERLIDWEKGYKFTR